MRGGILRAEPGKVEVDFTNLTWMAGAEFCTSLGLYFETQGFAEAVPLPYEVTEAALVVTRSLPEWGWMVAEFLDGIPF